MDIVSATRGYEGWLEAVLPAPLVRPDLEYKHERMADPKDPFPFFRGTYYRWVQLWAETGGPLVSAPRVVAIGDLHPENFGTWRDVDGRLCWGVNDFDEADELPYTNDLVRLAAGVRLARESGQLDLGLGEACTAILHGYRNTLATGGKPFVLEEHHAGLRRLAMSAEREPADFWRKLTKVLDEPEPSVPTEAADALRGSWPAPGLGYQVRARPRIGMGSLGRPRYVALAEWAGGWVAREVKAVTPPATAWVAGIMQKPRLADAVARAIRSADPFYRPSGNWIVRRLAPRCSRIELRELAGADVHDLLCAMGAETANVHLGTAGAGDKILADLGSRPDGWLRDAARTMCDLIERDWREWQTASRS
jgi:hypothetical protein